MKLQNIFLLYYLITLFYCGHMNQARVKLIIEELPCKEFHNGESIKFCFLAIFSSLPNFIISSPVSVGDIKHLIKVGNIYEYGVAITEALKETPTKFRSTWGETVAADIIIIKDRKPVLMTLTGIFDAIISWANQVIINRSKLDLYKSLMRKEIIESNIADMVMKTRFLSIIII